MVVVVVVVVVVVSSLHQAAKDQTDPIHLAPRALPDDTKPSGVRRKVLF